MEGRWGGWSLGLQFIRWGVNVCRVTFVGVRFKFFWLFIVILEGYYICLYI